MTRNVYIEECSAEVFTLYVEWLYRRIVQKWNTQQHLSNLYNLYLFAVKRGIINMADATIDTIQDICREFNQFSNIQLLADVYANAGNNSKLGIFCRDLLLFKYHSANLNDPKSAISPETAACSKIKLSHDQLKDLWTKCKDNFSLFEDVILGIQTISYLGNKDPRVRNEENRKDRCWYHIHPDDHNCQPMPPSKKTRGWVTAEANTPEKS